MTKRTLILVDKGALAKLLRALEGSSHYIRELQHIRSSRMLFDSSTDPISVLMEDYKSDRTKEIDDG